MASYQPLALEDPDRGGKKANKEFDVKRTVGGQGFTLRPITSHVELCEDEEGRACEKWTFDEDAYTMGMDALYRANMPKAIPSLLFALLTPILQYFICFQVFGYLASKDEVKSAHLLPVQLVCTALCLLQLSDEAVEGLHKIIFSIRWLLGFYEAPCCHVSALAGCMLGAVQTIMGVTTCVLCMQLIFLAPTVLDTFFNFVALAFISDVDNVVVKSRVVSSVHSVDGKIQAAWAPVGKRERARSRWGVVAMILNCVTFALLLPMQIGMNVARNRFFEDPVDFNWLFWIPRGILMFVLGNALLWLASRLFGVCKAAFSLTMLAFAIQVATWFVRRALPAGDRRGCFLLVPPERCVLWVFTNTMLPIALASDLRPFGIFKFIPVQIIMVMLASLMWVHDLRYYGCA